VNGGLRTRDGIWWLALPAHWPSAVIGGVSTRAGGTSTGHLSSLNLGTRVDDDPARVAANLERLSRAAGVPLDRAARLPLRHGAVVRTANGGGLAAPGDALVTRTPGLPLALTVADCYPVFLAARERAVALAHCGWRGAAAGLIPAAVRALESAGGLAARDLLGWVGPGIGPCCYELPPEDAAAFPPRFRGPAGSGRAGRTPIDLAAFIAAELRASGLPPGGVAASGHCTSCRGDLFYSHRRDAGLTGRMLAWIMLRGAA
jgi:YfiH family protein